MECFGSEKEHPKTTASCGYDFTFAKQGEAFKAPELLRRARKKKSRLR